MRSSSPIETEYSIDYTTTTTKGTRSTSPLHFLYPIMPTSSSSTSSPSPSPSRSPSSFLHHHHSSSSASSSHHHHQQNPHVHSLNSSHHSPGRAGGGGAKRKAREREREQQEIARLLDPSYQESGANSNSNSNSRRSLEVYVDKAGELHDPDFRYFPLADSFVSRTKRDSMGGRMSPSNRRGERERDRPYWDRHQSTDADTENALADEEEEEEEEMLAMAGQNDFLMRVGYGNGLSGARRTRNGAARSMSSSYPRGVHSHSHSHSHAHSHSYSYSSAGYVGYTHSSSMSATGTSGTTSSGTTTTTSTTTTTTTNTNTNTSYHSPTMTTTTLPTSYESEHTVLSSSAEQDDASNSREGCVGVKGLLAAAKAKRRRRFSKGDKERKGMDEVEERPFITVVSDSPCASASASPLSPIPTMSPKTATSPVLVEHQAKAEHEADHEAEEDEEEDPTSHTEYTPTCTQILRGHWLSISLRVRFGVYRAQRRLVRRVNSMF